MANLPDNDDFDSPIKSTTAIAPIPTPELTVVNDPKPASKREKSARKSDDRTKNREPETKAKKDPASRKALHKTTAYLTHEQWVHLHDEIHRLRLQGLDSLKANQRTVISDALDYYFARHQ